MSKLTLSDEEIRRLDEISIDPARRVHTPRLFSERYDAVIRVANYQQERGQPVTAAGIAERLVAVGGKMVWGGTQVIGDVLGKSGLGLPSRPARGRNTYALPAGGITRAMVEAAFDCTGWRWEDSEDEQELDTDEA